MGMSCCKQKAGTTHCAELLAEQEWARRFEGGSFATIYLAPFNYHRIHMPLRGRLLDTVYVPGRLFSVNAVTARHVPRLFARNERVLTLFDGECGQFALVLVGALNVGSIATVWAGDITPAARRVVTHIPARALVLDKGAELGRFNMGSTVILLFEANRARWHPLLRAGSVVQWGQTLGQRRVSSEPGAPRSGASPTDWRPTATHAALRQRAALLARVRAFFAARGVLEVETPVLSSAGASDPQIESLMTRVSRHARDRCS